MKLYVASLSPQSDEPTPVYGCTDPNALNYNPLATHDDGSCVYAPVGCFTFPVTFPFTFEDNCL